MKLLFALLCCCAAASATAEPLDALKARVAEVVERYVGTVACPGVKVGAEDVLALIPAQDGETMPRFAVLWHGDQGCWGGPGTARTNLAIATINSGRIVVQPELSSPAVAFDSPVRFIRRVVDSSADQLVLEGLAYGPQDPNSNPTVPLRFSLRRDSEGNWKLAGQTVLQVR